MLLLKSSTALLQHASALEFASNLKRSAPQAERSSNSVFLSCALLYAETKARKAENLVEFKGGQSVGLLEIRFIFYLRDTSISEEGLLRKMFPANMILGLLNNLTTALSALGTMSSNDQSASSGADQQFLP